MKTGTLATCIVLASVSLAMGSALVGNSTATAQSATAQSAPANGQRLFAQCAACHSLTPGARSGVGPNLTGMFGKRAGTVAADFRYSNAMKASTTVWTDATLNDFIAAPQRAIPGTRMIFRGVASPADRAALVVYLRARTATAR